MNRLRTIRPTVAVLIAAVLIIGAGSVAVASNMGFKMNKPLVKFIVGTTATQTGNNWTSIPYHNPYGTWNGFCTQTGLLSTGVVGAPRTGLTVRNHPGDPTQGFDSWLCGTTKGALAISPGQGVQIRQPNCSNNSTPANCAATAQLDSIIIVGSHNSGQPITITRNVHYFFSVPYHTTWVTTNDLCAQAGLTNTGFPPAPPRAGITRLNPGPPGIFQSTLCGATTNPFNLVLGEALTIFEPTKNPGVTFTPAHY